MALPPTFPDLTTLDLFVDVVRLGSLSKAAQAHQLSQPSASARVRKLERQLGLALLVRGAAGSAPTAEGERVAAWAADVLAAAHRLADGVAELTHGPVEQLCVAASYTVAEHLLPGWCERLRRQRAGIEVDVEVANSWLVLERVRAGAVQLGFVELRSADGDLASRDVAADELVVVVRPDHPWVGRSRAVAPSELADTPLVVREEGSGTRQVLEAALRDAGCGEPRRAIAFSSTAAVKAAAEAGAGPAVLSRLAVASELAAGRLVAVPVPGLDLHRRLRAVWRADQPLAAGAAALLALAGEG